MQIIVFNRCMVRNQYCATLNTSIFFFSLKVGVIISWLKIQKISKQSCKFKEKSYNESLRDENKKLWLSLLERICAFLKDIKEESPKVIYLDKKIIHKSINFIIKYIF